MNIIKVNNYIKKGRTLFGSLRVDNVLFDGEAIEDYLYKYVLTKDNLEYIFCDSATTIRKYCSMLRRFVPSFEMDSIEKYVENELVTHKDFYSFFAEALLPLVYRDVYGYELKEAAIDITQSPIDHNTGVDACLFDKKNEAFVAGEAKFYKNFGEGLKAIINNWMADSSIINKLDSLYRKMASSAEMDQIILKQLGKDEIEIYSLNDFFKLKIRFAGFVLHEESSIDVARINDKNFYDKYWITPTDILNNIEDHQLKIDEFDCGITIFHFFIKSKKDLIVNCIKHANSIMGDIVKHE